ncbi:MAG: hypothetical protein E7599_01675 [Ruminococcaceae bacterium]|nr:hypothetical protein [Oscillospiraceae bacterium]
MNVNKESRSSMPSECVNTVREEFERILSYLKLPETEGIKERLTSGSDQQREDKVGEGLERSVLLALAPRTYEGYIALPRALEDDNE